ncbi:MAG: four helix bundle protein [Bacteroidales bacterium]|nr:four helix bundle protein [Bacteroidales bacterium]
MTTDSFEKLRMWQVGHRFVLSVYRATAHFPDVEKFGLVTQFRRAAVSITANIAEGYKKLGKADKLRFFNISQGSLEECRNYIILSRDLGYINKSENDELFVGLEETSKVMNAYCAAIVENKAIKDNFLTS